MVPCFLGQCAHAVGERQRIDEIVEAELTPQLHDAVDHDRLPVGNLVNQFGQFLVADPWCIGTTGLAAFLVQGHRIFLLPVQTCTANIAFGTGRGER